VRMVVAERLVIPNHEPALVENARLQCVPSGGVRILRWYYLLNTLGALFVIGSSW